MQATAAQAMIPKARGMFAKRLSAADYEEMMRRRTVPEVAALLKRHPYFGGSLATLSVQDPHRAQIEELLSMDIFRKFQLLTRYSQGEEGFVCYYLAECEMREVLRAAQLLSIGMPGVYLRQIPSFMVGETRIDLFALGHARSFAQLAEALRGTAYYRPMRAHLLADPALRDYPTLEAAMVRQNYQELFKRTARFLAGREEESVRSLFLQEAEIHNLEVILRVKTYFPGVYPPAALRRLLLPYTYLLPKRRLEEMLNAQTPAALAALYRQTRAARYVGRGGDADELAAAGGRVLYRYARRMLHLTGSPAAAIAAFITLAKLERENVVNVLEGVRYGLPPEKMRSMLRY